MRCKSGPKRVVGGVCGRSYVKDGIEYARTIESVHGDLKYSNRAKAKPNPPIGYFEVCIFIWEEHRL